MNSDYISQFESKYFDSDLMLEKPITAEPVPERKGPDGTDKGGHLTSKIVGITSNPMTDQVQAFQEQIRGGASKVELGFMGTGKGNSQSPTPESMSTEDRANIRDLARLNEVETTVHAAPSVSNLSGFTERGFSDEARAEALNEINRAVDFAAEASTGGAVVVHWDEWQRPIESSYGISEDHGATFEGHPGEFKKGTEQDKFSGEEKTKYGPERVMFVDTETDEITAIPRDKKFTEPEVRKVNLKVDQEASNGVTEYVDYDYETDEYGNIVTRQLNYDDIIEREKKMNDPDDPEFGDFAKFSAKYFQPLNERWKEIQNMADSDEISAQKKRDKIFIFHFLRKNAEKAYEQYLARDSMYEYHRGLGDRAKAEYKQSRDMAWVQFQDQLQSLKNFQPVDDYSTQKAAETVSDAAIYAWDRSQKNKNLKRNLYIAPESVFPQKFGSHPDEMMSMIENARNDMKEKLVKSGKVKSEEEAQKAAESSIRATLDIGHLNMWRRHMKRKEGESPEQFEKRFQKWAVDKSKEMAEKGYVGHGHMSDNFGFGDEHLTVGKGNAPIKEFVQELRKTGKVDDFIVEIGSYNQRTAQKDAWSQLGVRTGMSGGGYFKDTRSTVPGYFNQVNNGYAAGMRKPSYVFGGYVPQIQNERWQGWSPWSGSRL